MILTSYVHVHSAGAFFISTYVYLCCEVQLYP